MVINKSSYILLLIFSISIVYRNMEKVAEGLFLSNLEQKLISNYQNGIGNIQLDINEFGIIKEFINTRFNLKSHNGYDIILENGTIGKSFIISFYNSPEFDHAFGTATIYVDQNFKIVGFMDVYDFDSRPWGQRSYKAEFLSRFIKCISPKKAKPFKITYGLQCSPPIYDLLSRSTLSSVS